MVLLGMTGTPSLPEPDKIWTMASLDYGLRGWESPKERTKRPVLVGQTGSSGHAAVVTSGVTFLSTVVRPNASEGNSPPRLRDRTYTRKTPLDVTQIPVRIAGHAPSHRSLSHLSRTVVFRSHPPDRRPPISIFWLGAWWSGGDAGNTRGGRRSWCQGKGWCNDI